jgi:formylglycine-generating enzyme required for sulfatase activity
MRKILVVVVIAGVACREPAPQTPVSTGTVEYMTPPSPPPPPPSEMPQAPAGNCPAGMVRVPAGTFQMGSPAWVGDADEHPPHEVTLSAYCIDRTEVTVKAYAACVRARTCTAADKSTKPDFFSFCNGPRADRQDHPINCVDWNQAREYCTWAGKRLPAEAEWEYAARGTDGRAYPWGNETPSANRLNACGRECVMLFKRELNEDGQSMYDASDGWDRTAPVGSFPDGASPFGALDMAGNVWEWTADWYGGYAGTSATNPRGAETARWRVVRGGAWSNNDTAVVRAANRVGYVPSIRVNIIGFRCVRGD